LFSGTKCCHEEIGPAVDPRPISEREASEDQHPPHCQAPSFVHPEHETEIVSELPRVYTAEMDPELARRQLQAVAAAAAASPDPERWQPLIVAASATYARAKLA
jgi:hypothetical protein